MAIGFTPKHVEEFTLNDLTPSQFLALLNETARQLRWDVNYMSDNRLIAYTNKGMFSWNAEIKVKIEDGIVNIQSASTGNEMMDWGKNKKTVNSFISSLEKLKLTITTEELDAKYQELKQQFVPAEEDILILPPATAIDKIKDFFSIFIPREGYYITPILIDLNILIFILMASRGVDIMEPSTKSLLQWGANFRPMTLSGQWWRLITNCFLHIGIFHLLMNMYALLYIGVLLEPHLGRTRFLSAYFLTGLTASIASLWWHDLTISAGASGAIFGMYGFFLAMLTTNLIEKNARKELLVSIAIFVGYNLLNGLKGGIDNAAHIGGLLGGLVIGYFSIPSLKRPEENKLKFGTVGLLAILILASSFAVYKNTSNDIAIYDSKMEEFGDKESMALDVYKMPESATKERVLFLIQTRGIYNWKECIKLVDSFKEMELPVEIKKRNVLLKEYCELRIKCYELLYKAISENSNQYKAQIDNYNQQIEVKMNELGSQQPPE